METKDVRNALGDFINDGDLVFVSAPYTVHPQECTRRVKIMLESLRAAFPDSIFWASHGEFDDSQLTEPEIVIDCLQHLRGSDKMLRVGPLSLQLKTGAAISRGCMIEMFFAQVCDVPQREWLAQWIELEP